MTYREFIAAFPNAGGALPRREWGRIVGKTTAFFLHRGFALEHALEGANRIVAFAIRLNKKMERGVNEKSVSSVVRGVLEVYTSADEALRREGDEV